MDIRTPQGFFGFAPGIDRQANWSALSAYFAHLQAQCDRLRLWRIGASGEGRQLLAVGIGAPEHLAALEAPVPGTAPFATIVRLGGMHATENTAGQGSAALVHHLACSPDPALARLWRRLVLIVVPAVDPDGLDRVASWINAGGDGIPPGGWRRWADHDLNRDWLVQSQPEVRAVAAHVLARFGPQVVLDMHEMWADGPRMFLPPYQAPTEPHIDPAVLRRAGRLGGAIAARLTAAGLTGIATGALFDAYSPARGYPFYHGAVRILCETAGPMAHSDVTLRVRGGLDPRRASAALPVPWSPGPWTRRDVQRYQLAATWTCLQLVATAAAQWPRWQAGVLERMAGRRQRPDAWHVPARGRDPGASRELVRALRSGGLRVQPAAHGWDVPRAQPCAAWAEALLSETPYPPGDTLPYDVTCHALEALLGVGSAAPGSSGAPGTWPADSRGYGHAFRRLAAGQPVWAMPPPARGACAFTGSPPIAAARPLVAPHLAIYSGWATGGDDAGWLRHLCARFGIPHRDLRDGTWHHQGVPPDITHIVLPAVRGRELIHGVAAPDWPPAFRGGLGHAGAEALRAFVAAGGHLLALEDAAAWAEVALGLPVAASPPAPRQESSPGSLVAVRPAFADLGLAPDAPVWAMVRGRTVLHADPGAAIASFTLTPPPQGSTLGLERLAGTAAVATVPCQRGRCTLFAFTPYFRAQSWATLPFFFNALLR